MRNKEGGRKAETPLCSKLNPACFLRNPGRSLFLLRNPSAWGGPLSSSGHLGVKDGGRERGGRERRRDEEKRQHNTEEPRRRGEWQEMKDSEEARGHKTERKRERQGEREWASYLR